MPSGEVMTRLVPLLETATNKDNAADQHTDVHVLAAAAVLSVHVMPSGEVMT